MTSNRNWYFGATVMFAVACSINWFANPCVSYELLTGIFAVVATVPVWFYPLVRR